ncbi:alkaline phosphatase, partial [bacterium]|nr:alkaline phosphatase [bacterium]
MIRIFLFSFIILFLTSPIVYCEENFERIIKKKTNVILLIGDGMGISQIAAAHFRRHGTTSGKLAMETMPVVGYLYTFSKNYLVSESASSGTALATGFKTNNRMISMLPDGTRVKTILQACRDTGMKTGLIATSAISHATPAVFASHVRKRTQYTEIASQLLQNKVDVLFGGGRSHFLPRSRGGVRSDGRNLMLEAKMQGYTTVINQMELDDTENIPVLGLFQKTSLTTVPGKDPSLAMLTVKAIQLLSKGSNGFFLMVEGSRIDWGCHANDLHDATRQTLLFDSAVLASLNFAKSNGNTLVIVTADHECGGLAVNWGSAKGRGIKAGWTSKGH